MALNKDETLGETLDRWSLAVGRVILAFAEVDWVTLEFLREFPRDPIYRAGQSVSRLRHLFTTTQTRLKDGTDL